MAKKVIDLDKIRKESPVLQALLSDLERININKGQAEILIEVLKQLDLRKDKLRFRRVSFDTKEIILRELLQIRRTIRNIARVKHIELN